MTLLDTVILRAEMTFVIGVITIIVIGFTAKAVGLRHEKRHPAVEKAREIINDCISHEFFTHFAGVNPEITSRSYSRFRARFSAKGVDEKVYAVRDR